MNYIDLIGDYSVAYQEVLTNGGQLYPGNGKDSAIVVVRGKNCYTYWKHDSKRRQEVTALSSFFNIDPYGKTGGRIARYLISEILRLPFTNTYWQKRYRHLAKSGSHWHYCFVRPYEVFYGIEVDLKSAYFSSLFAGKTLLYQDGAGYIPDNNALENLKELTPHLPKWFRLQILGCIASWRWTFLTRDKKNPDSQLLIAKQPEKILYGAGFNAAHRAILRNYKILEKVHAIGGEFIFRCHTDSFFLDWRIPEDRENEIWNYLKEKQVRVDVKGAGRGFFFDLNTGFIGRKFVGSKLDVSTLMRENKVKRQNTNYPPQVADRFGELIESSSFKIEDSEKVLAEKYLVPVQMELSIAI